MSHDLVNTKKKREQIRDIINSSVSDKTFEQIQDIWKRDYFELKEIQYQIMIKHINPRSKKRIKPGSHLYYSLLEYYFICKDNQGNKHCFLNYH